MEEGHKCDYLVWYVFQLILSRLFYFKGLSEAKVCEDVEDEELGPWSDISGFGPAVSSILEEELTRAVYMSNDVLLSRPHRSVREGIAQDSSFPHMLCPISHVPCTECTVLFWPNMLVLPLRYVCFGAVNCLVGRRGVSHDSIRTISIYWACAE